MTLSITEEFKALDEQDLGEAKRNYPVLIRLNERTPEESRRLRQAMKLLSLTDDDFKKHQREINWLQSLRGDLLSDEAMQAHADKWKSDREAAMPQLVSIACDVIGRAMKKYTAADVEKAKPYVGLLIHQCRGLLTEDEEKDLSRRFKTATGFLSGTSLADRQQRQSGIRDKIDEMLRDKLIFPDELDAGN